MKPTRDAAVAAVVRGRVVRLSLDADQKRALHDRDGQPALDVLRHGLGARVGSVAPHAPPEPFPLVPHFVQAVVRKLDHRVREGRELDEHEEALVLVQATLNEGNRLVERLLALPTPQQIVATVEELATGLLKLLAFERLVASDRELERLR